MPKHENVTHNKDHKSTHTKDKIKNSREESKKLCNALYVTPLCKPDTRALVEKVSSDWPPGDTAMRYEVTGRPPSEIGDSKETRALASPLEAVTFVGESGGRAKRWHIKEYFGDVNSTFF